MSWYVVFVELPVHTIIVYNFLTQVFLLASTLSLVFRSYFYSICLLYIVINNDILQRALQSITRNG